MGDVERYFTKSGAEPIAPSPVEASPPPQPVNDPPPLDEYVTRFREAAIDRERLGEVASCVGTLMVNKDQYDKVERGSGVPWFIVGCIHSLESNFNFDRHLHNGDPLTERTVHMPAGRPLFGTPPFAWYESAIDALSMRTLPLSWQLSSMLQFLEDYNGLGYKIYHPDVPSPYLWSFTNLYTKGKYAGDGSWNPNLVSAQCGSVAILKTLEQRGIITL